MKNFSNLVLSVLRNKALRKMLKSPYQHYLNIYKKKCIKRFHMYGFEALSKFNECMTKNNYRYSLNFGSLLGAVRENDFIPFDDDLDFAMWIEDYRPKLIDDLASYGIKLAHSFSIDNDKTGKELSFEYKGVQLDIFFFFIDEDGKSYCNTFNCFPGCSPRSVSVKVHGGLLPRKYAIPFSKEFIIIPFKNIKVPIPSNYVDVLTRCYGSSYMTPDPNWVSPTDYYTIMTDKIGVYKEYK